MSYSEGAGSVGNMSATRRNYLNRRCFTAIPRPKTSKKFCHACSYRLVKQVEDQGHPELNGTVLVHGIHRSKSELDVLSTHSNESITSQLLRERSHIFVTSNLEARERKLSSATLKREEVSVAKTTVPKKGLIKLTALDSEIQNPYLFDKKERDVSPIKEVREKQRRHKMKETQGKMLIRRKDIMDQVAKGSMKLMQEEEKQHQQDDLNAQISEFTFGDLQMNIEKLTDTKRQRSSENVQKSSKTKTPQPESVQRGLALPAINTINLFG